MRIFFLFLFLLISCGLALADEEKHYEWKREVPGASRYGITPRVNVITGEYIEEACDMVVAGCEPLSLTRFYAHKGTYHPKYHHWRYNPEHFCVANFDWGEKTRFVAFGQRGGNINYLEHSDNSFTFNPHKQAGFVNVHQNGQHHPLNIKVSYRKVDPQRDAYGYENYCWEGEIIDGSGSKKICRSEQFDWNSKVIAYKYPHLKEGLYRISPEAWTPYDCPIREDRRPNGNIICYHYGGGPTYGKYPTYLYLTSVIAYNSTKTKELGRLTFTYLDGELQVKGSDGRVAYLIYSSKARSEEVKKLLRYASTPASPFTGYFHRVANEEEKDEISRVQRPEGRWLDTEYWWCDRKVERQKAPVGPNGEMESIGHYFYYGEATDFHDAESNKIVYRYNREKRITAIERCRGETLYCRESMDWDKDTGNLLSKRIEDSCGRLFLREQYKYDRNHNVIEETIGDGQESYTIYRTFSTDGFNLKLSESDGFGKEARYSYKPGTNLLTKEFVFDKGVLAKRTFHFYDDCAALIKTIIDDGKTLDPDDVSAVTYRKIVEITPKGSFPCFGLPETVVEKTLDKENREIILKKAVYTYTSAGNIEKEEHYDGEGNYNYIFNKYDHKERLISHTDQLGFVTTYSYDENNNMVSKTGPRPDQHKEWVYDKADRPIKEAERQMDGSYLATLKRYNKLGFLVSEIDRSGFEIRFEYDCLGRLTATYYPDGSVVRKEHDVLGNTIKEVDAKGYETQKTYNFWGKPLVICYPDGREERFTYYPNGWLKTAHASDGAVTHYNYDVFGNPVEVRIYSSSGQLLKVLSATYSPFGILSQTDGTGVAKTYQYDYAGRKIREEIGDKRIDYVYDSLGRLIKRIEGDAAFIKAYDAKGQIIEERTESLDGELIKSHSFAYDAMGNKIIVRTFDGKAEKIHNTCGLPVVKIDPLGNRTKIGYCYEGGLTIDETDAKERKTYHVHNCRGYEAETLREDAQGGVISQAKREFDQNGNCTKEEHFVFEGNALLRKVAYARVFGPCNRIERLTEAGEKETSFIYNAKGRLAQKIKPDGVSLFYEYDDLGRLSRHFSSDFDYRYHYDANDRITKIYDFKNHFSTDRAYDALGNMVTEVLGTSLTFQSSFDEHGRRVSFALPDRSRIAYTYKANYLYTIERGGLKHTYSARDLNGHLAASLLPSDAGTIEIMRDPLARWTSYKTPFYSSHFSDGAYDSIGNLMHYDFVDALGSGRCSFDYDDLNQLIAENEHTYSYDSLNNRLEKDGHQHNINTLSQVTGDGFANYSYDRNGNLISDGESEFSYDTQDRLVSVKKGDTLSFYTYDPFHRRLSKKVVDNGKDVEGCLYLWDNDNEIGSCDIRGVFRELRVLGEGLGAEIGAPVLLELNKKSYIPISDHRGSLVALYDIARKRCEAYRYTSFGEELTSSNLSPWRFASKRFDPETGFYYFGRRYYNPSLGRWISPDPQGFADGPNLYAYLHNSPQLFCDCYGLWTNPFAGTHNFLDFCCRVGQCFFGAIEMVGRHLLPIPYARDVVESIGRFGAGGRLFDECHYQKNYSRIVTVPGIKVDGITHVFCTGMLTDIDIGCEETRKYSEENGGVETTLFYRGNTGLASQLVESVFFKFGHVSGLCREQAQFFRDILRKNPNEVFKITAHSQATTRLMASASLLTDREKHQMDVIGYGGSTIFQQGIFRSAENHASLIDPVCWTSPLNYAMAMINGNITIHKPSSFCPIKEHSIMETTYWNVIHNSGFEFQNTYLR